MIKLLALLKEDYGGDTYNIGMKKYTTSKPKLSQNEEKVKGADGKPCWRGYRYAGTENGKDKCVPMKESDGMCTECGSSMYEDMCTECGYSTTELDTNYQTPDHEVGMAQNLLQDIIKNAQELMQKIGDDEMNLPGWIQDHISQSQNFINQANTGYHEL